MVVSAALPAENFERSFVVACADASTVPRKTGKKNMSVSYTHLTLPTKRIV